MTGSIQTLKTRRKLLSATAIVLLIVGTFALLGIGVVLGAGYYLFVYDPRPTYPVTPGKVTLRYAVHGMALSPDRTKIAVLHGSRDESISVHSELQLFDVASGKELWFGKGVPFYNGKVAFSDDGKTVASINDLYDVVTGRKTGSLNTLKTHMSGVNILPGGRVAVGSGVDPAVVVYDIPLGTARLVATDPQARTSAYGHRTAVSPDGKTMAICGKQGKIHLWETATWTKTSDLKIDVDLPYLVKFSQDGKQLLCAGQDVAQIPKAFDVRIFDLATGASVFKKGDWIQHAVLVGDRLLSQADDQVVVYDVSTGLQLGALATGHDMAFGLDLSSDGTVLAVAGRVPLRTTGFSEVLLWDLKTKLATLPAAKQP